MTRRPRSVSKMVVNLTPFGKKSSPCRTRVGSVGLKACQEGKGARACSKIDASLMTFDASSHLLSTSPGRAHLASHLRQRRMISSRRAVLLLLLALVACVSTAWAGQDFRGQIQPNAELGHILNLGPNTRVVLRAIPPQHSSSTDNVVSTESRVPNEATASADSTESIDLAAFGQQRDRSTLIGYDGSFIFRDLEQGAYTLQVVSRTHAFERYRVDVLDPKLGKAPQIRIFTP